ncbi:MAG TPA: hypothetical protein VL172_04905 [Kofleriaceae bacterium]|jgi:hypothetical protein|nr:hypothetical protein [Kofleriaceae bacterium]
MRTWMAIALLVAACGGSSSSKGIRVPEARSCGERPSVLTTMSVRGWGSSCVQAAKEAEESLAQSSTDGRTMNDAVLADCLDGKRLEVRAVRDVMARDLKSIGNPGPLELDAQLIERRYDKVQRLVDEALECNSSKQVVGADAAGSR